MESAPLGASRRAGWKFHNTSYGKNAMDCFIARRMNWYNNDNVDDTIGNNENARTALDTKPPPPMKHQ